MKYPNPSSYSKEVKVTIDKSLGYEYFMDKEHPLSSKVGRVYMHRYVYSKKVGKWIDKSYYVHHLNENRADNNPENLEAVSPSMHAREHTVRKGCSVKKVRTCTNCQKRFIGLS